MESSSRPPSLFLNLFYEVKESGHPQFEHTMKLTVLNFKLLIQRYAQF